MIITDENGQQVIQCNVNQVDIYPDNEEVIVFIM